MSRLWPITSPQASRLTRRWFDVFASDPRVFSKRSGGSTASSISRSRQFVKSAASCPSHEVRHRFLRGHQVVLPEVDSDKALRLRDQFVSGDHKLLSPEVFSVEVAHALTRAERQSRIAVGDAEVLWADVMSTPPTLARSAALLTRAIEISSRMRIGVYDCLYVTLAERRKCKLVTADERLVNNLRPHFPFIVALSSLP
jgi:predicted nucleic acid-binding protein